MKGLAHTNLDRDWDELLKQTEPGDRWGGRETLERIRQSLRYRLEGDYQGGDIEVMRLVDAIVDKEKLEYIDGGGV